MKSVLVLSALAVVSVAAFAAGTNPAFDLAKAKTKVEFLAVGTPSALKIKGKVKDDEKSPVQGTLALKDGKLTGTASFELDRFDTGIELRNRHMKEKYLEVQKYPKAQLTFTRLDLGREAEKPEFSRKQVPFEGELELHGKKKAVSGTVDAKKDSGNLELAFSFKVKTSDFAIATPSFMGITVADDVNVDVDVRGPLSTL